LQDIDNTLANDLFVLFQYNDKLFLIYIILLLPVLKMYYFKNLKI